MERTAAPPPSSYRSPATRARWAYIPLVLIALVDLVIIALDVQRLDILDRLESLEAEVQLTAGEDLTANDDGQAVVALVYLALLVLAAITFIRWFSLAYRNLEALGASGLRYGQGWSIGAWFVPILNLFRPKQIANDIWRASSPELPREQSALWKDAPVPLFLLAWWLLWVVGNWILGIYARLALEADTVDADRTATYVDLVGELLEILAAVAAIVVIRQTTRRQDTRATHVMQSPLAAGPPPPPPPSPL